MGEAAWRESYDCRSVELPCSGPCSSITNEKVTDRNESNRIPKETFTVPYALRHNLDLTNLQHHCRLAVPAMPTAHTTITLVLAVLVSSLTQSTSARPLHFPPSFFTNTTSISPSQIPILIDPTAALAWNNDTNSPSILLCSKARFAGECLLLEHNGKDICLGLPLERTEVGSLRVGGGGGCEVFE